MTKQELTKEINRINNTKGWTSSKGKTLAKLQIQLDKLDNG
jgi:hypothetical protein|tara:strand:- start:241 stop:363 length:123 start_codon:yes stop_codon:yes gene_type:complete